MADPYAHQKVKGYDSADEAKAARDAWRVTQNAKSPEERAQQLAAHFPDTPFPDEV